MTVTGVSHGQSQSNLDFIDFWRLLWLLNTRATQIIGRILILAFFLIHFGMRMSTNYIPDATDFNALLISSMKIHDGDGEIVFSKD